MKCLHNRINKHRRKWLRVSCNNNSTSNYSSLKRTKIDSSKKILIVLVYMLLSNSISHLNAQSCSLCKINHTLRVKNQKTNYEEFIFEHQVTRQDAVDALQILNESFFDGSSANSCKSITCTRNVMKYCYGPQFINDHCWCELGHSNEGLPFVPHICYVGDKQYQASVGSCFFYEEVKECCCAPALAKKWKYLSGGTVVVAFPYLIIAALAISAINT